MGILDRLRTRPTQPAKTPRGQSGRGHYDGFLQLEELNSDLAGVEGLRIYDRMWRTDPDVRRVASMVINPLLAATAQIIPHGEDEAEEKDRKAAELIRWALFDAMRPGLPGHLAEALPVLVRSGFTPFEQIWRTADYEGRTVIIPRKLGLRLPRTIVRWPQDRYGDLKEIVQQLPTGPEVPIPARDLLYYRVGAEGDNWEGTSLFRPIYKPWWFKDQIERLDAIAQEREATGYALVYPPNTNVEADTLDDLEEKVAGLRAGETGYLFMPGPRAEDMRDAGGGGWHFELVGYGGTQGGRQAKPTLEYHRDGIAAAFVAEFMRLGQAGEGARATADVQQDPFLAGVEALAAVIEGPINEELIPRICALNLDVDEPPKLQLSLVDSTSLVELKDFVAQLVERGVLGPDGPLEDFLRKRADLPAADPEARRKREEAADEAREQLANPDPPGVDGGQKPGEKPPVDRPQSAKKTLSEAVAGDTLRFWERTMALDDIAGAIDDARTEFERRAGALAREYAQAAAAGPGGAQPPAPDALTAALEDVLEGLYATGRRTVVVELDAQERGLTDLAGQGTELDGPDLVRAAARAALKAAAALAAAAVAARVWQAISRRRLAGRATPADLQAIGEREAAAALRAEAIAHAAPALNLGRSDQADDDRDRIAGAYYTSILDTRRCTVCKQSDDDVLRRLDDPVRLARKPPNPLCEGGGACRCMEAYRLREESSYDLSQGWRRQPRDPGGEDGGRWVRRGASPAEAASDLFRNHADEVRNTVAGRYGPDVADDASMFAWAQLAAGKMPADHPNPVAWLVTVAMNEAAAIAERDRQETPMGDPLEDAPAVPGGGQAPDIAAEVREQLSLLSKLKPAQKQCLELLAAGFTYDEVASRLGKTRTWVNRHTTEGRAALRKLAAEGGEL